MKNQNILLKLILIAATCFSYLCFTAEARCALSSKDYYIKAQALEKKCLSIDCVKKMTKYCTIALKLDDEWIKSNRSLIYFDRGNAYLFLENFDKAIQDYTKALNFNDNINGYRYLAHKNREIAYNKIKNIYKTNKNYPAFGN